MRALESANQLALVTGACSGIGLEFARQLAALGHPLVLVSNRQDELQRVSQELTSQYGITAWPLAVDLARAEAAAELYQRVQGLGLQVEILINNAGIFFFGEVVDAAPDRALALLQLHVVTPSLLARYFGKDMRDRRRGHILFVSSISAWQDFPGIAFYGSSKRYLRSFAVALRSELRPWGVNVTVVAPGATATGLYEATSIDVPLAQRLGIMMRPGPVAEAGLKTMFKRRALVIPGLLSKVFAGAMALSPRWLIDLIRRRAPWLPRPRQLG